MAAICMHQLANLPVLCNMQSNVLNDLAKAKRRWTEKNPEPTVLYTANTFRLELNT